MQIGEVRKFQIDKNKKKSCELPGLGVIEIEIKKEKGTITKFSYEMVGNEEEVFVDCDHGYILELKKRVKMVGSGSPLDMGNSLWDHPEK